jgi:hypothetical protein
MITQWEALAELLPVPSYSAVGRKAEASSSNVRQAQSFLTQEGVIHSRTAQQLDPDAYQ